MSTGYADIDNLMNSQNQMLTESLAKQQEITNKQTDMNVAELERNRAEVDKDATKANRTLYTDYRKSTNPYGVNAENLASQGLANSGYAETTQTNLYNTYQKNITETLNNARQLKSDFDFKISQARQNGDITLAQNALELYKQRMQLRTQEYELKNNRDQYEYQKQYQRERDTVSDNQWQQQFEYQKQRDAVADSQWQKQYELSKKASASSSRSSRSSGSKKKSRTSNSSTGLDLNSSNTNSSQYTAKEILSKAKMIQAPQKDGTGSSEVIDGISGKRFSSIDEMLKYYNV